MPEGDVLFRTAATLRRWLGGREVTAATTAVPGLPASRMVGLRVDSVEAWGKHLLIRFDSGEVLHTHLRMSGSWHVYREDDPWRRPERQARLSLTCGDRLAVCFNAPVVELLAPRAEQVHPALSRLGPDVLDDSVDLDAVHRRVQSLPPGTAAGDLLLDQAVVSGIGNIYRCEAMFLCGVNPWTPRRQLAGETLDQMVLTAGSLMRANLGPQGAGTQRHRRWVYRRSGRPCRRCGSLVESRPQGVHARIAYWCPTCQPAAPGGTDRNR